MKFYWTMPASLKGDYTRELEKYQSELFKGNFSDVRRFYRMADLFTLTSYGGETFSFAALEAMAFGLPCSLTNIGGADEMVIEGKTGVLSKSRTPASIAESWHQLLNRKLQPYEIRQFVVENFDAKRMFEDYYKLLVKN